MDAAGMSGRDLHRALQGSPYAKRNPVPSHATLQRRINGEALANSGPLIEAIIQICTPAEQVAVVQRKANELQRKAWREPTPIPPGHEESEVAILGARVDYLTKLYETQRRILREDVRKSTDRQRSANDTATLIWLLAAAGNTPVGRDVDGAAVQNELRNAKRERDDARQALAVARAKIRDLEERVVQAPIHERTTRPRIETGDDIERLHAELLRLDPSGSRLAHAITRAMDAMLDGSRTGRFRWDQLTTSEKASVGTRIEFEVRREFSFGEGRTLDFVFADIEFDLTYSTHFRRAALKVKPIGRIVLLIVVERTAWSAGLIAAERELLSQAVNRDGKAVLGSRGSRAIRWLHLTQPLPENVLVDLSAADVEAIFAGATAQQRVNELLRRAQRRIITGKVVATVAMQDDAVKRVRDARHMLAKEDILVLSHSSADIDIARRLGVPIPARGEWVSTTE
ncbi:NaeI family type II restriction endonuclease [Nocardia farcinica]|uniref:NaeI family type II restriction endonuclease n=1 Tax=Nocardia farcinica TaxID=37329 RepID=UPI0024541A3C|nr:NaeI family type II restriction endonuclease [Nocardia farcinica]